MPTEGAANPFEAWASMAKGWTSGFASGNGAGPFEAWRQAMSKWAPASQGAATSAPWQDAFQSWMNQAQSAAGATPLAPMANMFKTWADAVGSANATNPLQAWQESLQKWAQASAQMFKAQPSSEPWFVNPFDTMNPMQAMNPAQLWQGLFQQYAASVTEAMSKDPSTPPTADTFRQAERNWLDQLDATGKTLADSMSTTEFSQALGKSLEQSLVAQGKMAKSFQDQANAFLQAMNIPSRPQIDRLFERVIAIDERLEEVEVLIHQLRRDLKAASEAATAAPASG